MASMATGKGDNQEAPTGLARARLLAESAGMDSRGPLLAAVAERLALLLSELDSVSDEDLQGVEPATTFLAADSAQLE